VKSVVFFFLAMSTVAAQNGLRARDLAVPLEGTMGALKRHR